METWSEAVAFLWRKDKKGTVEDKSRRGVRARVNAPLLYNKLSPRSLEGQSCLLI